jgi:flagellar biosynthesis activator protein FlaF
MPKKPLEAYRSVEKATLSGRDLEASVLERAATMLQSVRENWSATDRDAMLDDALRFNQRLWTFFQAELMDEANPLPAPVKTNLLNLSGFVDKRTFEVMATPASEKLKILIDINRNIAAGLRGNPGTTAAT